MQDEKMLTMNENFYRPIVIQTKEKVAQKRPIGATFDENRAEIDKEFSKWSASFN